LPASLTLWRANFSPPPNCRPEPLHERVALHDQSSR
jgi:hypothetical protein